MTNPLRQALASLVGSPTEALVRQLQRTSGEYAAPFYSPLELATERSTTARAPGAQWLATLGKAPGVKQEEIDATGLGAFLGGRNGPVARDELLAHLRANRVDVADMLRGGAPRVRSGNVAVGRTREEVEQQIEEDFQDEIFDIADEEITNDFFNNYRPPRWQVLHHHPYERPFALVEPDLQTPDMFDPELPRADHFPPGQNPRWWIAEALEDPLTNRDLAYDGGHLPDGMEETMFDVVQARRGLSTGPFRTRAEAQRQLDDLLERHQDRELEAAREQDHYAWGRARNNVVEREIGRGDYTYDETDEGMATKWKSYSLPGGQNYGEMTFSFPKREGQGPNTHWPEPNVFGHVRFQDRNVDGKKTLFIEEVQSDWHQRGREGGYQRKLQGAELQAVKDTYESALAAHKANYDALVALARRAPRTNLAYSLDLGDGQRIARGEEVEDSSFVRAVPALLNSQIIQARLPPGPERTALDDAYRTFQQTSRAFDDARYRLADAEQGRGAVPDAPFKDNKWAALVMKRMIRYASENGYDQVAWHPGNLKNGDWRPDSSKPAGWEFYDKILPNIVNDITKKSGVKVGRQRVAELPTGSGRGVDPDIPIGDGDEIPLSSLAYAIAQESSDLGRWRLPPEVERIRHLYAGSPAVEVAQELRKAMGLLDEAPANAHVLPLTDELKNKALYEGFPLFALPGALATALLAEKLQERMRNRRRESRA